MKSRTGRRSASGRERLRLSGEQSLSDAELLAVLLGTGTACDPVSVVQRLLEQTGGLRGLRHAGLAAPRILHRSGADQGLLAARRGRARPAAVRPAARPGCARAQQPRRGRRPVAGRAAARRASTSSR